MTRKSIAYFIALGLWLNPIESSPKIHPSPSVQQPDPDVEETRRQPASFTGNEYGMTSYGDTLWAIALRVRPDNSITVQQTMLALRRANPEAFINDNINLLKAGYVLRVPSQDELSATSVESAVDQVRFQNQEFDDYKGGRSLAQLEGSRSRPSSASRNTGDEDRGELKLLARDQSSINADTDGKTSLTDSPSAVGSSQSSKTREQLFREVFKRAPPIIPVSSYVIVLVDNVRQKKVKAEFSQGNQSVLVEGKSMLGLLHALLQPNIVESLGQKIDERGWIDRTSFQEVGLSTSFDAGRFEFSITTKSGLRVKKVQDMGGQIIDPFTTNALRPSPISGHLNFDLKYVNQSTGAGFPTNQPDSIGVAASGAMNIMGLVLEGSVFGNISTSSSLRRSDFRFVYDQPRRAIRYAAGDLRYPVIGFQTVVNIGGIGVSKDFSLQPHLRSYRTGQFGFYLERPAEVQVWVNDSLVRTLQLPAGTHDVRGLTLATGQNDSRLVIEDNAGHREELFFSFIHNPILLQKGRRLFSYNAGFHRQAEDGNYHYDTDKPILSASYQLGYSDETTLGVYTQAGLSRGLFGVKAITAFSSGSVQFDLATSRSANDEWDFGSRIEWIATPNPQNKTALQSQVLVEYLGPQFGSITAFSSSTDRHRTLRVQASMAYPLGKGVSGRLSGNYRYTQTDQLVDGYGVSASLTRKWGKYTTARFALRHNHSIQNDSHTEWLFGIRFSRAKGKSSFNAGKDLETNAVTSRWDSGRPSNFSVPYGFAATRLESDLREYKGGFGYWGNQGLIEASYTRINSEKQASLRKTTLRLQSALVAANGSFAFSRPVRQNFLIVKGREGLAGIEIRADPDGTGGCRARSGWLGPAVLTDLQSYRLRDVSIEPTNPPLGASPGKMRFSLLPYYKSGFVLEVGKVARLIAVGRLVNTQQEPISHMLVEIQSLDHREDKPISTFTSRNGRFQMPDVRPGRYKIRPPSSTIWGSVIVEIEEMPNDLYRLGDIVVSSKPAVNTIVAKHITGNRDTDSSSTQSHLQ